MVKEFYGPYPNGAMDRLIMVIWDRETNTHTSQSYPRFLMEQHLGRELSPEEEVHHKDTNKDNNSLDNLIVLTVKEHHAIHNLSPREMKPCKVCGSLTVNKFYCSDSCSKYSARKVEWPTREQLINDVTLMPLTKVGQKYGVSDNAVRKWCKKMNIDFKKAKQKAI